MSCFPCFGGKKKDASSSDEGSSNRGSNAAAPAPMPTPAPTPLPAPTPVPAPQKQENHKHKSSVESVAKEVPNIAAQTFTFRELAAATKHFSPDCVLGEGSLGKVYKGCIESTGEVVAVKKLDRNGEQGNKEFLVEVQKLSLIHHPNLIELVGYCADGDQRLLVHEFMPRGSLADHLFEPSPQHKPLDWYTRMRIAFGAAQGLEYLHDKANPPVIYRDLKSSSILLDDLFTPKLSDYGQTKLGAAGEKSHAPSMVMGSSYGYCAPEYARSGQVTPKSDVYSFGVVLLELISGRRAIDTTQPINEQNLVSWAQPMFKDQKRYPELVDPVVKDDYPAKGLNQAVAVAAMCLQDEASVRPLVADLVIALSFLFDAPPTPQGSPSPAPAPAPAPAPVAPPAKSSSSSDSSSDEDEKKKKAAAAAVQLGRKSTRKSSRSSSKRSSRRGSGDDDDSSDGGSSRRYSRRASSRRDRGDDNDDEDDDNDGSSSSKHSHGSPRGSEHSASHRESVHGSGGYSSRHYEECEQHDHDDDDEEEHEESE